MNGKEIGCGVALLAGIALSVAMIIFALVSGDKADAARCAEILSYARTTRDTMEVKLRCEAFRVERERTTAISVGAGMAAGAIAGSAASSSSSLSSGGRR